MLHDPLTREPDSPVPVADYANVAGNHYDKYGTRNPIARRLMAGFMSAFDALVARATPSTVFEIGCGEGELSRRLLRQGIATRGCDLEPAIVAQANAAARTEGFGEPFCEGSLYNLASIQLRCDLIVCCEVLEHLPDPERALDVLQAQRARQLILSVPREPVWRMLNMARGKYLRDLGNTPGHIQHWSSPSFVRFVDAHFEIVELRQPFPWTMVLCQPR